jgi:hypothetical protein
MTNSDDLLTSQALADNEIPAGYDNYADEILVANGRPPRWFRWLPYVVVVLGLAYYVFVRAFDTVNLIFGALLIIWLVYTPLARKKGWFFIPL